MRDLLFRLLKKQHDGSYKVVGFERHIYMQYEGMRIQHNPRDENYAYEWYNLGLGNPPIQHDRKDQYTGIEIDRVKVFEKSEVSYEGINEKGQKEVFKRTVLDPFRLYGDNITDISWLDLRQMINLYGINVKLTGKIQGVTND